MVFGITFRQMAILFLFMALGYLLMKRRALPENAAAVLSKLLVQIFLPAMVFNTFSTNFHLEAAREKLPLLMASVSIVLLSWAVAIPIARALSRDGMTRNIYIYSLTVPNMGYMGYPIVGAVLGEEALMNFMIMAIPSQLFIYTAGMYMLNPKKEFSLNKLVNPTIVFMLIGMAVGLSGWRVPEIITSAAGTASGCMAPCAMLLTGFVLAKQPVGKMLSQWRSYLLSGIKLIAYPLIGVAVMSALKLPQAAVILGTIQLALPFGLNSVVFPEAFGGDSTPGAQLCFVGNLMAMLTIPMIFSLLSHLFGI